MTKHEDAGDIWKRQQALAHAHLDLLGAPRLLGGFTLNVVGRLEQMALARDRGIIRVWEAELVTDRDGNGPGDFGITER